MYDSVIMKLSLKDVDAVKKEIMSSSSILRVFCHLCKIQIKEEKRK